MNEKEILEFWRLFCEFYQDGKGSQRKGQAMMNALAYVAMPLYDMVSGTDADIFYVDDSERIYKFRQTVGI